MKAIIRDHDVLYILLLQCFIASIMMSIRTKDVTDLLDQYTSELPVYYQVDQLTLLRSSLLTILGVGA